MRQTIEDETVPSGVQQEQPIALAGDVERDEVRMGSHILKVRKMGARQLFQLVRFGLVGGLNTTLDLLVFNAFLLAFPTKNTLLLLAYNSLAYAIGGINSFMLNKYWTFQQRQRTTRGEVLRFIVTTLLGIGCNDLLIWLISGISYPLIMDTRLWANASKICAIFGTVLISYLGMRLWVFAKPNQDTTGA